MATATSTRPRLDQPSRPLPGWTIAALAGPLLLAVTNALVNFAPGSGDIADTADVVEHVGAHPVLTEVTIVVGLLACALLVPGIWAVAQRLLPRTPRLATIGGWMMATGYVMAVSLSTDSGTALAVARAGGDPSTYADAIDNHTPLSIALMYGVFGIGALGGGIVLAIAILRQRGDVPSWAGWVLLASEPVRVIGLIFGIPVGPPLASLLIVAAFAGVLLAAPRATTSTADTPAPAA